MTTGALWVERTAAPVREQVTRKLREAIINRSFPPGTRLIERDLCEMSGASRTPVREALRQLEAEGLVEVIPNRGPVVASITVEEAQSLYEVRAVLEGLVGRAFAQKATDEQIARLGEAAEAVRRAVDSGEFSQLLTLKDAFYGILLEGSGNAVAAQMLGGVHVRITYLRGTTLSQPGRPQQAAAELQRIFERARARQPDEVERLCVQHVRQAGEIALAALRAEEEAGSG